MFIFDKIYFDMDGVLADFEKGVVQLCKLNPLPQSQSEDVNNAEYEALMWRRIRDVPHFYDRLEMMPGIGDLFAQLCEKYPGKIEILSAIPKPKKGVLTAKEDKISWVRRLLSTTVPINIVYREEKQCYCRGEASILIDDYEKNVNEWIRKGGTGIIYQSVADLRNQLQAKGIL